jgi:AAA+ ATPase superfamily predicted ATPase/Holliday junction resolvase
MFRTSLPVSADTFHDRQHELSRLAEAVERLRQGTPSWVAVIGSRKIGKTSLVTELARRAADASLVFVVLDVYEVAPPSPEVFRLYALRTADRILAAGLGASLERLARQPAAYRRAVQECSQVATLPPSLRAELLELAETPCDQGFVRTCLEIPERLAAALGVRVVVAIDEFQELAVLATQRNGFDPFPLMRSVWQRHERVGYIVSGSSRSMLGELITAEHAPFFQHFTTFDLGPFSPEDAASLLVSHSPPERRISPALAGRAVEILGGHPFYLQVLGEALVSQPVSPDEPALKSALQELLFSRSGRLGLYFQNEFDRLVGRSTYLAAALESLAEGPQRLTDLAHAIGATSGATAKYLERLTDAVRQRDDGNYELADAVFGLWLRWRRPGGSVVPMTVVGDEAERDVANHLSQMGFELVYQSRGSRGAFDLLAVRGATQLGIQVRRAALPLRFSRAEWNRMVADAERFGWQWIVAAVAPDGDVRLLDPAGCRRGREVRLDQSTVIDNLLLWLAEPKGGTGRKRRGLRR